MPPPPVPSAGVPGGHGGRDPGGGGGGPDPRVPCPSRRTLTQGGAVDRCLCLRVGPVRPFLFSNFLPLGFQIFKLSTSN